LGQTSFATCNWLAAICVVNQWRGSGGCCADPQWQVVKSPICLQTFNWKGKIHILNCLHTSGQSNCNASEAASAADSNSTANNPTTWPSTWSFSSLLLAASSNQSASNSSDGSSPAQGNGPSDATAGIEGMLLLRPPLDPNNMSAVAAAAWLDSGAWLVPEGLANVTQSPSASGAACGPSISAASSHGRYLSLRNLTMLVNPQSLMLVQQALCIAAASPAAFLSVLVVEVCVRHCSSNDSAVAPRVLCYISTD
jgi:hypothetical protein